MELSILIPCRYEEWAAATVESLIETTGDTTEILIGLDGAWADPKIPDHPRVKVVFAPEALGQRGMTNYLCKLSKAKYVAKTDGHCAFEPGFDRKLIDALKGHDDWTIAPAMKNLHAFNWECEWCGMSYYQGEKPELCRSETCHFEEQKFKKVKVFEPRNKLNSGRDGPTSTAYRFTPDKLQFKYFGAMKNFQTEEIVETMSLQGSFFMLTRENYWKLKICDESWGGWGQQGTEVALKTWLSGGRVVIHKGTWYAHMFRTNNQLAFPWNKDLKESQGTQQHRARQICADLFKNNKWELQTRPLSWLIERFWEPLQRESYKPEEGDRPWTPQDLDELKKTEGRFRGELSKGILYFTDNALPMKIARPVRERIKQIARDRNMELVSSTRKSTDMGKNVTTKAPRGYETMFKQILKGLENMTSDIVFMAEHDVLYPPEHFDFTPTEHKFYYDVNWVKVHPDGVVVRWRADQVSGLCAFREDLIAFYRNRLETFDKDNFDRKFEPLSGEGSEQWEAPVPHIDIRHGGNLTYNKRSLDHFRKKETAIDFKQIKIEEIPNWNPQDLQFILE